MESKKWAGRYFVDLVAEEFSDFKNVSLRLFRPDMPEDEAAELLKLFGVTADNSVFLYICSYVAETFDLNQVIDLVKFFSNWEKITAKIEPAEIPGEDVIGVGAFPVGGLQGFYMFSEADDYPLKFNIYGYYNLRDCEPTSAAKVELLSEKGYAAACRAMEGCPEFPDAMKRLREKIDWYLEVPF